MQTIKAAESENPMLPGPCPPRPPSLAQSPRPPPGLTRPTRGRSHLPAGQPRLQHKQAKPTKPLTTPVIPQAPHKRGSRGVGG